MGYNDGIPITEDFFSAFISGKHNSEIGVFLFPDWDQQRRDQWLDDKEALFRRSFICFKRTLFQVCVNPTSIPHSLWLISHFEVCPELVLFVMQVSSWASGTCRRASSTDGVGEEERVSTRCCYECPSVKCCADDRLGRSDWLLWALGNRQWMRKGKTISGSLLEGTWALWSIGWKCICFRGQLYYPHKSSCFLGWFGTHEKHLISLLASCIAGYVCFFCDWNSYTWWHLCGVEADDEHHRASGFFSELASRREFFFVHMGFLGVEVPSL